MSVVDELVAREEDFRDALMRRDRDAADAVLAEGYALELMQPVPAIMERADWLRTLEVYVVDRFDVAARSVAVSGDVATVLMHVDMDATVAGEDRSGVFIITDVWLRQDGVWCVWRRHSTPLSAGELSLAQTPR